MMRKLALCCLLLALAACGDPYKLTLKPVTYNDLPGWQADQLDQAFQPFAESCVNNANRSRYFRTKTNVYYADEANWRNACNAAMNMPVPTPEQARVFFETYFEPYRATTEASDTGLTTGYYEPLLHGSMKRTKRFDVPVYGVPYHLTKPYFSREEIERGAIKGKAPVLLYVDDKVMLFFLQIQGSGKVILPNGEMVGLQYAGQNGFDFVPIGRVLKERGVMNEVSMQSLRDWLKANPGQADEVMNQNPSYIFFKLSPGDQYAKGALGLPLTPGRSIAIDDDRVPYGSPVYLATQLTDPTGYITFQRLMVAQDTGGALKGPTRYDLFLGRGEQAEWHAGHQNARATVFWLLPREAQETLPPALAPVAVPVMAPVVPDVTPAPEIGGPVVPDATPPAMQAPVPEIGGTEPPAPIMPPADPTVMVVPTPEIGGPSQ